jgi:Cof subfamily protein (haloacid dehalogenase superfamily)
VTRPRPPIVPDPAFPIRFVALDIDGTLVGPDLVVGERTRAAVASALAKGVRVSLATGRMSSSALRFADTLGLTEPLLAYQGALVRDMPARPDRLGRLRYHRSLPGEVAVEAIRWTRAHGMDPHLNHLERIILREDDPGFEDYSVFHGARVVLVEDLEAAARRPVTKVVAVADAPAPTRLLPGARLAFAGRAEVTVAHPRLLEFVAPGVSKGRSLLRLVRRAGIPAGQVLAIGDSLNDLEMVAAVGHGAAMAGAAPALLAVARYVAAPVEAEGAAQLI